MTRLVTDSFTESADKALTAHTPDLGGAWSSFSSAVLTVTASDGRVHGSDIANAAIGYNAASNAANVAVAATVRRSTATANEGNPGLVARLQPGADSRYLVYHSGSQLVLFKRVGGSTTVIGTATPSFAVNTDATIELRVNGSDLQVLWNGAAAIAVSDAAIGGAGYAGITARLNGTVDNLTIDTMASTLSPARAVHAASSDAAPVSVTYALAPAKAWHAGRAGGAALSVAYPIAPAKARHGLASDDAVMTVGYALGPADGAHASRGGFAALSITYQLIPAPGWSPLASDAPQIRLSLTPPGAGLSLPIAADLRGSAVPNDPRTEEIPHG